MIIHDNNLSIFCETAVIFLYIFCKKLIKKHIEHLYVNYVYNAGC